MTGPTADPSGATHARLQSPELRSAISKASRRLMPMIVVLYVVAFLDRTNVSFATEALEVDRGISAAAYAFGAGVFFLAYAIFEIPSNLALQRFGAKAWLARIAISWGIVSTCFAFVQGETSFIVLRCLLGITEAGLFPGIIMFLAEWFPNRERVRMFAIFYLAQPFSQMIGSPLSGALLSIGDRTDWIAGWQLMFAVEGLLAVVAGIAAFFFLVNSPQDAKFLDAQEKAALRDVMVDENAVKHDDGPKGVWAAMRNGKVWYFTVIYFCLQIAVYGVTFGLPSQVSGLVGREVGWEVGLITAIPWFVGIFSCYFVGRHAVTVRRRRTWGALLFVTTGLFIFGSAWAGTNGYALLGILFITLAVASFLGIGPITWSYPTAFLTGTAAAAGIGLVNSLGNLGGFVAPILRERIADATGSDTAGIAALGVLPFVAAVLMLGTAKFRISADALLAERSGGVQLPVDPQRTTER
ncbi:MFS transporter [Kineococcus sp. T13]|uniref:MFS transporter n=1 Tax=Kineococcus vitellinus TaxID=2696565 RepID=UPI001412EEC2|nr:MFS transporter [Kineococcus vitellinus]NAZ75324.1 MFS transporter [Kineococcus vitellinus]